MDPALQEQLLPELDPNEEIEALLRLKDPTIIPAKVRRITQFGDVISCRIRRSDVLEVYNGGQIISLKASRFLAGDVYEVEETEEANAGEAVVPDWLEEVHQTTTGKGVVIGIIDWGADFAHVDFVNVDGTTRLLAIWNQADETSLHPPQPFGYGRVFHRAAINAALATPTPYHTLGYHPGTYTPRGGSHGTHVMSIAAGNGRSGVRGIAPEADLIFVHLASKDVTPIMNLGDSVRLLEAIDFIQRTAGNRPLSINISVGRHGGSHDGLSLVEMGLDNFLSNRFNTAICQSTGNYFETDTHSSGIVLPGRKTTFSFNIDEADVTPNELEIWYSGRDIFDLVLTHESSGKSFNCPIQQNTFIRLDNNLVGRIYHRANEPNNSKNHINIFLYNNARKGNWAIELIGKQIVDGRYQAWIERDSGCKECQSKFAKKHVDTFYTTGTICNGFNTIVVGAVNPSGSTMAPFSSSGPTTDGRNKPNILADGVRRLAARSGAKTDQKGGNKLIRMSGTSMAAPQVTGAVALLLQAIPKPLHSSDLRTIVLQHADPFQEPGTNPQRTGNGILNIPQALNFIYQFNKSISMQPLAETIPYEQTASTSRINFGRIFLYPTDTNGITLRSKRPAADRAFPNLDEALMDALARRNFSFAIVGNLHTGTSFEVYELDINVCLLTPLVIRTQWSVPNVCAIVIEPLVTYMPANAVNIGDRWIQIPRLGEFYNYPLPFKRDQKGNWRRLLRAQITQIQIPGVTINDTWLNALSVPALRLLLANFAAIVYSVNDVHRRGVHTGVVMNGTTIPVFKLPLSEPDYAISVISRAEGRLESINAWDNMAGISIGPIQFNTIDGHLHRFLWDVWEQDRALFNAAFGTTLQWTMRSANGRVFLSVLDANQNRVEIADNQYLLACGYFMTGNPAQNCNSQNPVRDLAFRRRLTERFRTLLVWPHVQELVMEASNRYLLGGLNILHRANSGIIPINASNPDRDTFILKALLLSMHVRFSAYTGRIVTYLQQYQQMGTKLRNLSQALISEVSNATHRQELDRRLQNQRPIADETFGLVQARLQQLTPATTATPQRVQPAPVTDAFGETSDHWIEDSNADAFPVYEGHPFDCNCQDCTKDNTDFDAEDGGLGEALFQTNTPNFRRSVPLTFACAPPIPYVHPVTHFPNIVNNPDVIIEQAFRTRGITAAETARFRANGGFTPILPIAMHFGDAFAELLAQLRYPNSWILNPRLTHNNADTPGRNTEPYLAPRLLLAIPGFFRELARNTTNYMEAYSLESLGWLVMYRLRDLINQATNNNWWLPPQPGFVKPFPPNSLTYVSMDITNYAFHLNLFSPSISQSAFNRNAVSWRNSLAGRHWQAEIGQTTGLTPDLLFYPSLVTIPAAVNTQVQRQQIDQAWQARVAQIDQQFPMPSNAGPQQTLQVQRQRTQALTDRNQTNPTSIRSLFNTASFGNVRLAYEYPQLVNTRNNVGLRQRIGVLNVLRPVVESIFQTIEALGWNDLLFHTMGGQLFRGIGTSRNPNESNDVFIQRAYSRARQISDHAYGLALDLNYVENPQQTGAHAAMAPRLVALFEAFGFEWGYCYRHTDGHHFQYNGRPFVAPVPPPSNPNPLSIPVQYADTYSENDIFDHHSDDCGCSHEMMVTDEWYSEEEENFLDMDFEDSNGLSLTESFETQRWELAPNGTVDEKSFKQKIYKVLEGAGFDPDDWFDNFTQITFLGRKINNPIHVEFATHLKLVEKKLAAKYGNNDPKTAGDVLHLTQESISGGRRASSTASYSMHTFGLAMDVNYQGNPYLGGKIKDKNRLDALEKAGYLKDLKKGKDNSYQKMDILDKIFNRMGLLINGIVAKFPRGYSYRARLDLYDKLSELNSITIKYFNLIDDPAALEDLLKKSQDATWNVLTLSEALSLIKLDFDWFRGLVERYYFTTKDPKTKKELKVENFAIKKTGFLNFDRRFVEELELDWGATYGDIMHFDMRNTGIGQKIHRSILAQ